MQMHTLDSETLETFGQMFIDIGKITALHQRKMDLRFHFRKLVKKSSKSLSEANEERQNFGMYDDCGDFYENRYYEARGFEQGVFEMRSQIIRLEKYQKLCIHKFKNTYPIVCSKLLEQELQKVTIETNNYLLAKT